MQEVNSFGPISPRELMVLGVEQVAYVRQVESDGQKIYVVHTADGSEIARGDDRDLVFAAIRQHGLEPVSVH